MDLFNTSKKTLKVIVKLILNLFYVNKGFKITSSTNKTYDDKIHWIVIKRFTLLIQINNNYLSKQENYQLSFLFLYLKIIKLIQNKTPSLSLYCNPISFWINNQDYHLKFSFLSPSTYLVNLLDFQLNHSNHN